MMSFVSMTILRFTFAIMVGVLIAFTALLPIFGAIFRSVVGAILILLVFFFFLLTYIVQN